MPCACVLCEPNVTLYEAGIGICSDDTMGREHSDEVNLQPGSKTAYSVLTGWGRALSKVSKVSKVTEVREAHADTFHKVSALTETNKLRGCMPKFAP